MTSFDLYQLYDQLIKKNPNYKVFIYSKEEHRVYKKFSIDTIEKETIISTMEEMEEENKEFTVYELCCTLKNVENSLELKVFSDLSLGSISKIIEDKIGKAIILCLESEYTSWYTE